MKVKRFLSMLLCLCMILTLLPMLSIPVSAKASSGMKLGTNGIMGYSSTSGYNYIYFGQYDSTDDGTDNPTPIKWRVLASTNGNGGTYKDISDTSVDGNNAMFLLSEYLMRTSVVVGNSTEGWASGYLKTWMTDRLYNGAGVFTSEEKTLVLKTTTTGDSDVNGSFDMLACQLNEDKLFTLSADEATRSQYGFGVWNSADDNSGRVSRIGNASGNTEGWALRSPWNLGPYGFVDFDGCLVNDSKYIGQNMHTRPAFNLNKSSVIFASAATEAASSGKASGSEGADALVKVSDTKPGEWKLTLLDSSRNFGVTTTAASADSVSFDYYGAKTGANEYISAVIVDDLGYILYYGRIVNVNNFSGSATVNIPAGITLGDNATLKVFNGKCLIRGCIDK